jgi:hypothetical protein
MLGEKRKASDFNCGGYTYRPGVVIHEWLDDSAQTLRLVKLGEVRAPYAKLELVPPKAAAYAIERLRLDSVGGECWDVVLTLAEDVSILAKKEIRAATMLVHALEDLKK